VEIYLNLARRLKISGPNQLWIADITYIRLRKEFVYLAVILDAYSRMVVGWALDRSLRARLALTVLEHAIMNREPPPGVVHHSDRGVQYASDAYVRMLRDHGMMASMSRPGNPYDNATCESFLKTLKREEICAKDYYDLEHLLESVGTFIERYYNRCRLHSSFALHLKNSKMRLIQQLTQRRRGRSVNAVSGLMPPYPWSPENLRDG
jgi:transposase InsO family protein